MQRSMMIPPRFSTSATAFALAAMLALGLAAGAGGVVVCTDDDGPPSADRRSCGCCTDARSPGEDRQTRPAPPDSECDDCIDVPTIVSSVESRSPSLSAQHTTNAPADIPFGSADGCCAGPAQTGGRPDHHRQTLSSLSTVVLLT